MGAGGDPARLRVAVVPFGSAGWLGGLHYLSTLLSALADHASGEVEAVLVVDRLDESDVVDRLQRYVGPEPVIVTPAGARLRRAVAGAAQLRNPVVEASCRDAGVDVVFQHASWLGPRFGLPTVAWLGDLQHRVLPDMFSGWQRWRRELRFQEVLRSATLLYVLSEADRTLGQRFYPRFAPKLRALPFAVALPDGDVPDPVEVRERYGLPERFLLFPGQLWRHKNHLGVIEAVALLKRAGQEVVVAACGNPADLRDPTHAVRVAHARAGLGVEEQFRVLGLVPRPDVWALLRCCAAVLYPSLYEGWSTPVEEAKAVGAPLLLSDLPVHREQCPDGTAFFDPGSPSAIAGALDHGWRTLPPGPRPDAERHAAAVLEVRRQAVALGFVALVREAASSGRWPSQGS